jgi:hypothetical protein
MIKRFKPEIDELMNPLGGTYQRVLFAPNTEGAWVTYNDYKKDISHLLDLILDARNEIRFDRERTFCLQHKIEVTNPLFKYSVPSRLESLLTKALEDFNYGK